MGIKIIMIWIINENYLNWNETKYWVGRAKLCCRTLLLWCRGVPVSLHCAPPARPGQTELGSARLNSTLRMGRETAAGRRAQPPLWRSRHCVTVALVVLVSCYRACWSAPESFLAVLRPRLGQRKFHGITASWRHKQWPPGQTNGKMFLWTLFWPAPVRSSG